MSTEDSGRRLSPWLSSKKEQPRRANARMTSLTSFCRSGSDAAPVMSYRCCSDAGRRTARPSSRVVRPRKSFPEATVCSANRLSRIRNRLGYSPRVSRRPSTIRLLAPFEFLDTTGFFLLPSENSTRNRHFHLTEGSPSECGTRSPIFRGCGMDRSSVSSQGHVMLPLLIIHHHRRLALQLPLYSIPSDDPEELPDMLFDV